MKFWTSSQQVLHQINLNEPNIFTLLLLLLLNDNNNNDNNNNCMYFCSLH